MNNACLEALARLIIANRAYKDGEVTFANEVLAGAWDHTNRADIRAVLQKLTAKAETVAMTLEALT